MSKQMSIRLDDSVHRELAADAKARGIGLATYLRDLAADHAKNVRRLRIRAESLHVGELYRSRADVRAFYDAAGSLDISAVDESS